MPTNFPTSVDALTNPNSGDALTSPSHASQHTNANDAIEAIETYVLAASGIDYAQITTPSSITATTEGTANTVITGASKAYIGETVLIEFYSPALTTDSGAVGRSLTIYLFLDGTSIGTIAYAQTPAAAAMVAPCYAARRYTPTTASHTFSIRASVSAGTGTVNAGLGNTATWNPAFMRVSRVLP